MHHPRSKRRALAALSLAAMALVLPLPGLAAGQHVVKSGETLSEIAERYGVSVERLIQLNGIKNPDLVEAGTRLKLPEGARAGSGGTAAGTYTVKAGETLSEIAERHGLSVQKLMELNGIKDADLVQEGQRLKVPAGKVTAKPPGKSTGKSATKAPATTGDKAGAATGRVHVVKSGETLSEISERYDVPVSRLVSLNKLEDPDNLLVGSKLKLGPTAGSTAAKPAKPAAKPTPAKPVAAKPAPAAPTAAKPEPPKAAAPQPEPKPAPRPAPNPPEEAVVQPATQPAPAPAAQATATPAAPKPAAPKPAAATPAPATPAPAKPAPAKPVDAKPAVAKPAVAVSQPKPDPSSSTPPDWRTYGPLQVDFSNWRLMGGSQVAPALNSTGQPIFVSINCAARKINATGEAGAWKTWEDPSSDFEEQLIKDVCKLPQG